MSQANGLGRRAAAARRQTQFEVRIRGPFDPAVSLEMFRRSGDDLLDRWDGRSFIRTVDVGGRRVAFATGFSGTVREPVLRVTVEDGEYSEPVEAAVRATFIPLPRHFAELRKCDPAISRLEAQYRGLIPVLQRDLLGAFIRCISAQQVNLRWAAQTRQRLAERFGDRHSVGGDFVYSLSAERLASAAVAEIRALQFTTRKAEFIVEIAQAIAAGRISLARMASMSDDEIIAEAIALRGIGLWTAEWILARTLGRPRVVAGDLGVRKAVGMVYGGGAMPAEAEVRRLTSHWERSAAHAQAILLHGLGEKQLDFFVRPSIAPAAG